MEKSMNERVQGHYRRIALEGNAESCCTPDTCCSNSQEINVGYAPADLASIPTESFLGVGCRTPLSYSDLHKGETVVDLGSGAGIDVFLSANKVGNDGKVIGVDMTDEMLDKARKNGRINDYVNVEFRKGDIEKHIPVEDGTADLVISNCVINLVGSKTSVFKEVHRILRYGGRMVISDLVTDREMPPDFVSDLKWCSCIDGALTKEHYLDSIRSAGFDSIEILQEKPYMEGEHVDGRKISSITVR